MRTELIGNESTFCIPHTIRNKTKIVKFIGPLDLKNVKISMEWVNKTRFFKKNSLSLFLLYHINCIYHIFIESHFTVSYCNLL